MSQNPDHSEFALLVATLSSAKKYRFELQLNEPDRALVAKELGLSQIRKLRFVGETSSVGRRDWTLRGQLGATVVQPCVQTLEPVVTRIDSLVERRFVADFDESAEPDAEVEIPEDDNIEPLGDYIDPWRVMTEALALLVPDYPRSDAAEPLGEFTVTEPGKAPLSDADTKPFAGLAALKDQLSTGSDES